MASLQHKLMSSPSALNMLSDMSQITGIRAVLRQTNALESLSHALRPVPFNDEVDDTLGDTLANVCLVITIKLHACMLSQLLCLSIRWCFAHCVGVSIAELLQLSGVYYLQLSISAGVRVYAMVKLTHVAEAAAPVAQDQLKEVCMSQMGMIKTAATLMTKILQTRDVPAHPKKETKEIQRQDSSRCQPTGYLATCLYPLLLHVECDVLSVHATLRW